VPTCQLSHLSEADKRAYVLADNKLAEKAGWDKELLAIELQGLIELDVDIELTGFAMAEIDLILEEARETTGVASGPEDTVPEPSPGPVVSQTRDLWLLGTHRLLCGDARDKAAYAHLMDGAKAEFVFTDPPYNVAIDGHVCGLGRVRHREFAMGGGEMSEAEFTAFLTAVFGLLAENSIDGSIHQICMDWRHMEEMLAAGRAVYSELKNLCIWNKTNAGMGLYRSKHELRSCGSATAAHLNNELGQHGRIAPTSGITPASTPCGQDGWKSWRCTQRLPVALVADAIKDCSRRAGLVLDPSCGSGTILIQPSGPVARRGRLRSTRTMSTSRCGAGRPTPASCSPCWVSETFETTEEQRPPSAAA
jgi:hypothetical protein